MTALSAPAALAQTPQATADTQQARVMPPNVPATAAPGVTGAYDGRTLDAFARATRIVGALRNEYSPKIAVANIAGRPERAEALFDEMRARMHLLASTQTHIHMPCATPTTDDAAPCGPALPRVVWS